MENATTQLDEIIRSVQKRRKSRRGGGDQHKIRRELWMGGLGTVKWVAGSSKRTAPSRKPPFLFY